MAKKITQQYQALSRQEEYSLIKKDLLRVLFLNCAYLIIILALYFTNQKNQWMTHWFAKILHF